MTVSLAIIGRPNVGKSTLFNRLVGKKLALVDDQPGVTRDRRSGAAQLGDLQLTVTDTAGLEQSDPTSMTGRMRAQTEAAIADSDGILFVIDARAGIVPDDRHFADLLRRAGKPIFLIANKAEGRVGEAGAYEAFELGFGTPIALSAEHNEGFADLYEAIATVFPQTLEEVAEDEREARLELGEEEDGSERDVTKPLRVAIVGRPNAGKSTLINRLVREERMLTGPEAGLTRDSIGLDITLGDRAFRLYDTAGLRKRARIEAKLEKLAVADALRAVQFAEIVVVLLDATIPFEKQDLSIVDLVSREGRGLVIGLNKWDLIEDKGATYKRLREDADRLLPQVKGMPVVPLSGLTGVGEDKLIAAMLRVEEIWSKRISTGRLNRWLAGVIDNTPPPAVSGWRIKIRYMTQPKARPPYFVIFGNQLDELPTSYERFLINGLRTTFDLPGVPIRITKKNSRNPFEGKPRGKH